MQLSAAARKNGVYGAVTNEVANTRIHATTGVAPCVRLPEDQAQFGALPIRATQDAPAISHAGVLPFDSLQHPLSVYESLLESAA